MEDCLQRALEVDAARRYPDAASFWSALALAMPGSPLEAASAPVLSVTLSEGAGVPLSFQETEAPISRIATGQNRVCTMLLVEVVGTSELAGRLDPAQLAEVVDRCMHALRRTAVELGGDVSDMPGDLLMVVFGAHAEVSGSAERAVHTALRMRRALTELTFPQRSLRSLQLALRIGIHTGRVFVSGSVRPDGTLRVTGTPLKRAASLQQSARDGDIVIGLDTYRHVAGLFEVKPLDADAVESGYRVIGLADRRHDLATQARVDFFGLSTSFVGREQELGALTAVVDSVLDEPRAQLASLLGPRGAGKSRILVALVERLDREGFTVLSAPCTELHAQHSYAYLATVLRARFCIHDDDEPEIAAMKLRRGLREALEDGARPSPRRPERGRRRRTPTMSDVVDPLLDVLGLAEPASSRRALSTVTAANSKHNRVSSAVATLIRWIGGPVALVCDDAHWIDPGQRRAHRRSPHSLGGRAAVGRLQRTTAGRRAASELAARASSTRRGRSHVAPQPREDRPGSAPQGAGPCSGAGSHARRTGGREPAGAGGNAPAARRSRGDRAGSFRLEAAPGQGSRRRDAHHHRGDRPAAARPPAPRAARAVVPRRGGGTLFPERGARRHGSSERCRRGDARARRDGGARTAARGAVVVARRASVRFRGRGHPGGGLRHAGHADSAGAPPHHREVARAEKPRRRHGRAHRPPLRARGGPW